MKENCSSCVESSGATRASKHETVTRNEHAVFLHQPTSVHKHFLLGGATGAKTQAVGELSDKACEIADAPAVFKSVVWKSLGFTVSGKDETGEQTNLTLLDENQYTSLAIHS